MSSASLDKTQSMAITLIGAKIIFLLFLTSCKKHQKKNDDQQEQKIYCRKVNISFTFVINSSYLMLIRLRYLTLIPFWCIINSDVLWDRCTNGMHWFCAGNILVVSGILLLILAWVVPLGLYLLSCLLIFWFGPFLVIFFLAYYYSLKPTSEPLLLK